MKQFRLRKGIDIPISGSPKQTIEKGPEVRRVAVLGNDYIGLKPRMAVEVGDIVGRGAPILAHKNTPDVFVTAPASGRVAAVNRGYRRALISVEIDVDEKAADPIDFSTIGDPETRDGIKEKLCAAGLWTSFRTRPYSKVPASDAAPHAIYVTAMDTEPLAPNPAVIIQANADQFLAGLKAVSQLSDGKTFVCVDGTDSAPTIDIKNVEMASFSGPHPAGLPGTHMHFLEPPSAGRTVWTIGYQDVIAIGHLMQNGELNSDRVVALSGPLITNPRLIKTVAGASLNDLTYGEFEPGTPFRLISGSVLSGTSPDDQAAAYLGRYARQVTLIEEDRNQNLLSWIRPMPDKFAVQPVLGSSFMKKLFPMTSNLNGGRRAMVPVGTFEELMPQRYLPTQLLRALLVMDTDVAQALGALELDEEDLSLVTFACPAKYEYGSALRACLEKIEKEG
ncbi:MAG: Na(+)-translocating NADH-quinone reductase subunit A [Pseudomonadota bacterium]